MSRSARAGLLGCALLWPLLHAIDADARGEAPAAATPLAQRIGHTDPASFGHATAVHAGAGAIDFTTLLDAGALATNLIFVQRGVIEPHSGVGEHFHNQCEELFVILDGEAQFTVNGRTALLKGPAGAPNLMGHAHAIYNATDRPVQFLTVNVGMTKRYDSFDLGDPRTQVKLDPIAQFITMRLDHTLLMSVEHMNGGAGVVYAHRLLGPEVFSTPWSYVDYLVVPAGSSVGSRALPDMSEVYYVLSGQGQFGVGRERADIRAGDAVPVGVNQARSIKPTGSLPLEFMIVGIARDMAAKQALLAALPTAH